MTALRLPVDNLLTSPNEAALAEAIAEHVRATMGRRSSPSEIRSWQRSLPVLARDLADAGLHRVEMLVEYKPPDQPAGRRGPRRCASPNRRGLVRRRRTEAVGPRGTLGVGRAPGHRGRHGRRRDAASAERVRRYCEYMCDFLGALNGKPHTVSGAAYLHNAMDLDVDGLSEQVGDERSRLSPSSGAASSSATCARGCRTSPAPRPRTGSCPARSHPASSS